MQHIDFRVKKKTGRLEKVGCRSRRSKFYFKIPSISTKIDTFKGGLKMHKWKSKSPIFVNYLISVNDNLYIIYSKV